MDETARATFSHWANFYVLVGSAAGALTGLQFVVMTLVAQSNVKGGMGAIRAFASPTIVQFCSAMLISATMAAPWDTFLHPGICMAVFGAGGLVYSLATLGHARRQNGYTIVASDWFWYISVPLIAYLGLSVEGILLAYNLRWSMFLIAPTSLVLLYLGIHNSWDTVTYVTVAHRKSQIEKEPSAGDH